MTAAASTAHAHARRPLLVAVVTVLALGGLSGSQAAATTTAPVAAPRAAVAAPAAAFRSVRTYQEVALPVRLRIPAAGVDTPLQRLGRSPDRTIQVPDGFGTAGWFAEGPRPGQAGPAVILGHVDSATGPAVFSRLSALVPGSEVLVDRADGSTVMFRVTALQRVPKAGFPTELVYGPSLVPSLRLVTCGGSFDHATRSYRDNVIAYAEPAA